MADLIDRDELRKDFCNMCEAMQPEMIDCEKKGCMSTQIIDIQPAVNRWIPCSERLPEVYEKVLTYNDEGIIHDNFRLNLRDGSVGWSQGWGITHWQPRPEPPKEDET